MGGLRQSLPALVAGRLTALPAGSCRLVRYLQRAQPLARRSGSLTSRAAKAGARRSPPAPQARWRPSGCGCRTARSGGCPRPPRSRWGPSSVRDGGLVLEGRVQAECRRVPGRRDVGGYFRQTGITMFRYAKLGRFENIVMRKYRRIAQNLQPCLIQPRWWGVQFACWPSPPADVDWTSSPAIPEGGYSCWVARVLNAWVALLRPVGAQVTLGRRDLRPDSPGVAMVARRVAPGDPYQPPPSFHPLSHLWRSAVAST